MPWSRPVTERVRLRGPRSRSLPVLLPLAAATTLLAAAALLAACDGSTRLTAAGLPADGPTRTPAGAPLEPAPPAGSPGAGRTGSAADLVQAARAAFAAAPSVHVTGTLVRGAQGYDLDLWLKGKAGATARIVPSTSTPGPAPHPEVRVVRIGDVAWVGGNLGFWRGVTGDDARARRMVGSWVKVAVDGGNFAEYVAFTRPETIGALLPDPAQAGGLESAVPFGGRLAVPVVVGRTTRLTVAADGTPYPLQVSGLTPDGSVSRFLNFSDYGAPVSLRAPVAGEATPPGTGSGS